MKGIIFRIARQMKNDKRSLALMMVMPLMLITLLYFLLGESNYVPSVGLVPGTPQQVTDLLSDQLKVTQLQAEDDQDQMLKDGKIDAVLELGMDGVSILMVEPDSTKLGKITAVMKEALPGGAGQSGISVAFLYDNSASSFDSLSYVLLGVIAFFVVFILSGVSFIRERTTGTMERMMLTPVPRTRVALGYSAGFGVFAVLQSVIILLYSHYVLGVAILGSPWLAVLVMVILALSAVVTGMLISIFANNEFQVVQFIPVVIIPQIFFSGMIPIDTLPYHLGLLSYIMPIFYGSTALKLIILRGEGFAAIWPYMLVLVGLILILSFLNTKALKKYRKI
jgi:ABC-2 type transport system permease protein